jgi:KaiC/GvpD/RAD55 family RecA-like ATPase
MSKGRTQLKQVVNGFEQPTKEELSAILTKELYSKYGFMTIRQIKETSTQRIDFIIQDLVPKAQLGILVGEYTLGKSPLALQMAITVAQGGLKFLGSYETSSEPVRTLYIDFENAGTLIGYTGETQARYLGLNQAPDTFLTWGYNYSPQKFTPTDQRQLIEAVEASAAKLVIIDPLRSFDGKAEEKNAQAMVMIGLQREVIRRTGATVLLFHHPNKNRHDKNFDKASLLDDPVGWMDCASGASALVKNVDFRIGMAAAPKEQGEIILRANIRMRGWLPVGYLVRDLDDDGLPKGYRLLSPLDKMAPEDVPAFSSLPMEFSTKEARIALRLSDHPVSIRLKAWADQNLTYRLGHGVWRKREFAERSLC